MKRVVFMIVLSLFPFASRLPCSTDDALGDQILAHAKSVYSQDGPKAALPEYGKALAAYRKSGNRLGEAITIGLMGNCHKKLGDYPKALELLNSALAMKRELNDRLEEGKTLSNLGLVYWEQGDYPEAIRVFNQSILIAHELGNVQLEASALNNLSLVYDEQGDYHRSLQQYQKALELHRSIKYEPGVSDTLGNIGGVYLSLGHFSQAENYYQQALEISRRLALKQSETQDLGNIAVCEVGQGKLRQSLKVFDQAIALAEATGMFREAADWYRGKASAQLRLGLFDVAMHSYAHSEELYAHAGLKREESEAFADRSMSYFALGDTASAEEMIRHAIKLAVSIGYSRGAVLDQLALVEISLRSGNLGQARTNARTALSSARKHNEVDTEVQGLLLLARISHQSHMTGEALTRVNSAIKKAHESGLKLPEAQALELRGELLIAQHHPDEALASLDSARAIADQTGDVSVLWQSQSGRGYALEQLTRPEEALAAYRSAIDTIESVRALILQRRFRTGYFQDKQKVYVAVIALLLRMGRADEAFQYSERLREYSYTQLREGIPELATQQIAEAKSRVRHLQEMLDKEGSRSSRQQRSEALKNYSSELIAAQRELQMLLENGDTVVTAQVPRLRSPEQIMEALPPGTSLLEYIIDEKQVDIFVLSRTGLSAIVSPVRQRDLEAKVNLLRDLIADQNSDAWLKPAESLRRLLITPVEDKHLLRGISSLMIVAHGTLNNLPFGALPAVNRNQKPFLAEQYEISELPAAMWLLNSPIDADPKPGKVLAVAPTNSHLKFAIPEAKKIASIFAPTSESLLGARATETKLKDTADSFGIIHLATHGFFNRSNPLFSGLQLQPDSHNDGRLEVHEIMALHLKARLVTLSACETALGGGDFSDVPAGDEFIGLSRAFLAAGSDAVLASLWKVDDRSTSIMMTTIYGAMRTHDGPRSLAIAQRAMIRNPQYRHPFYWAPFVYIGKESNPVRLAAEKR